MIESKFKIGDTLYAGWYDWDQERSDYDNPWKTEILIPAADQNSKFRVKTYRNEIVLRGYGVTEYIVVGTELGDTHGHGYVYKLALKEGFENGYWLSGKAYDGIDHVGDNRIYDAPYVDQYAPGQKPRLTSKEYTKEFFVSRELAQEWADRGANVAPQNEPYIYTVVDHIYGDEDDE